MKNSRAALLLIALIFWAGSASAQISASFQSASGTRSLLIVEVNQADGTLIVEEHLPPGSQVVQTSPPASKVGGNRVTWLVKRSPPGRYSFAVRFATPLSAAPTATIKYQDRGTGRFIRQQVRP